MKQLFTILFILILGNSVFAQEQKLFATREVAEMAVFPGCEKIAPTNKNEMNACLSQQLSEKLANKLMGFDEVMQQSGISGAVAKIQFVISKEGIIIDIRELKGSNPILADAAVQALSKIAEELPPIRPAKIKKGTPVNIVYQLPVKYEIGLENKEPEQVFPVDEIVLFTLSDKDSRYEIRLFKNKEIKMYERKNGTETYLGRFLSLNEVERSEPYKSLIDKEKNKDRILVTDGNLDDGFYEIYIYNLFKKESDKPVFVEVVKVDNGKKKVVSKFEKEADFNQSRFAPLLYRD